MRTVLQRYAKSKLALPLLILPRRHIAAQFARQSLSTAANHHGLQTGHPAGFHSSACQRNKQSTSIPAQKPVKLRRLLTRLNKYLPSSLRVEENDQTDSVLAPFRAADVLAIHRAANKEGIALYEYLLEKGNRKAVIFLLNSLLENVPGDANYEVASQAVSNIEWPRLSTTLLKSFGDNVLEMSSKNVTRRPGSLEALVDEFQSPKLQDDIKYHVWQTLCHFVQHATNVQEGEVSDHMSVVLRVIGTLHQRGLIPDAIYDYKPAPWSSYLKRPPILHIVSSRILTSLSDVAWRDQQDDAIAEATESGMSLEQISSSVPGGRFRLKVRPLPVEIWLEYVLWCTLEAGYSRLVYDTIMALGRRAEESWSSIRWCSPISSDSNNTRVDWDRLKLRIGGSVGLIEGYSREEPFVQVPPRTVSVELVIATIDQMLDVIGNRGVRTFTTGTRDSTSVLRASARAQRDVLGLLNFLVPHDLSTSYLDYLESRIIDAVLPAAQDTPLLLRTCSDRFTSMRTLQKQGSSLVTPQDLELQNILEHSLLHVAIKHEALEALVSGGVLHSALATFNDIQEIVDSNKIGSITSFLHQSQDSLNSEFFTSRAHNYRLEYAESDGQLPHYKLAGFLDLTTDARLSALGEWLLYSDDLDGAIIPATAYGTVSLVPALTRFAASNGDEMLSHRIAIASRRTEFKPTVRMYRAIIDADIVLTQFGMAKARLDILAQVQGGGLSISTLASLAAAILRLENRGTSEDSRTLRFAERFMDDLLRGHFDSKRGDFTLAQRTIFRQQVSHMLRLFNACEGSILRQVAQKYANRFLGGNQASLPPRLFNVFFSAYADTRGLTQSCDLYTKFCGELNPSPSIDEHFADLPLDIPVSTEDDIATSISTQENNSHTEATDTESSGQADHHLNLDLSASPYFREPVMFSAKDESAEEVEIHAQNVASSPASAQDTETSPYAALNGVAPYLEPTHVVMPSLRTLRIIAQLWVSEKQSAEAAVRAETSQIRALDDLRTRLILEFKKLGLDDRTELGLELETTLSSEDLRVAMSTPDMATARLETIPPTSKTAGLWRPEFSGHQWKSTNIDEERRLWLRSSRKRRDL